ncbi:MAG: ribokinase [Thermoguttaceae bacterium]
MSNVVVIGSSNTDMVVKTKRIPIPGETVIGGDFLLAQGGKGANQAVAAARVGANVTFVAKVGQDIFGEQAIASYIKEGINTDYIFRDSERATGVALILVDAKGENLISVASGANEFLSPTDIDRAIPAIEKADVLVAQLETPLPTLEYLAKIARKYSIPLFVDPAPAPSIPLSPELLHNVTCIKPNETETERLTGVKVTDRDSARIAAQQLLALGVQYVIITLGSEGSLLLENSGSELFIPSYSVDVVDTTAAGDAFSGSLAWSFAQGKNIQDAAKIATAVAALSVTRWGAQPSLPTKAELDAFLEKVERRESAYRV